MESRTERLVRAVGNPEAYAVVRALLQSERTTTALAKFTELSAATLERTLETLSQASVVSRRPGTQGAWYVVHWPETFAVFKAARQLAVAIQGSEDRASEDERELFARLEAAGGAAAPAARGRPRAPGEE